MTAMLNKTCPPVQGQTTRYFNCSVLFRFVPPKFLIPTKPAATPRARLFRKKTLIFLISHISQITFQNFRCLPANGIANHLQIGDAAHVESRDSNGAFSVASRFGLRRLAAAFTFCAVIVQLLLISPTSIKAAEPTRAEAPKKLHVVTTIFPIYCFASGVIGSEGEVQNLLPANVEPHDYQLSPSDLRKIKQADLVIMNGLGLDNWVMKALEPNKNRRVISLGSLLNKTNLINLPADLALEGEHKHGHEHQHGAANPHIWLDPQIAIQCVNIISSAIASENPACRTNAESYVARLTKLDSDIATQLAPVRNKAFITQHDAFPYFVRRFQLKQVGVIEVTPDVSPSPRYLSDLLKVIREKNVPVIFTDPRASQRLAKQIARDTKIHTADLDTLESESGTLDPKGYEQGMRRNAATLVRELK